MNQPHPDMVAARTAESRNYLNRTIVHKWRKLGTVLNFPMSDQTTKITPRAHRRFISEVPKEPTTTSKALQTSIKVRVHE